MLSWIVSSSILILLMMALRAVIRDRVSPRLRYALWLLVLVRLLLPVSLGSTRLSVLNAVETAEAARGGAYADTVLPHTSAVVFLSAARKGLTDLSSCSPMTSR